MGQLFLWTQKTDSRQREQFSLQYGFELPDIFVEMYENLPEEFVDFLGFFRLETVLSEERRPLALMPGLVPFAGENDGDLYAFYLPWTDVTARPAIGLWLHETNHFLPITRDPRAFMIWWMVKEVLESLAGEDWDEMRKILELFQGSVGLEDFDLFETPPATALAWHEQFLLQDEAAPFSLTYVAKQQFSVEGIVNSLGRLKQAEAAWPQFGAPTLWSARLWAMNGQLNTAHEAYWRHLRTPMFANGYHYWWHAGDLQVPEFSEIEAANFLNSAQIKAPEAILRHPKLRYLLEEDPFDHQGRLALSRRLEREGDEELALIELENALFLQHWDDESARLLLERLLCVYPEVGRVHEAEQCRRALGRLR